MRGGNHYEVLGVPRNASGAAVHQAFRQLMRRFHPDVNSSPTASAHAAHISNAFATLSRPDRRAAYDVSLELAGVQHQLSDGRFGVPPGVRSVPTVFRRRWRAAIAENRVFLTVLSVTVVGVTIVPGLLESRQHVPVVWPASITSIEFARDDSQLGERYARASSGLFYRPPVEQPALTPAAVRPLPALPSISTTQIQAAIAKAIALEPAIQPGFSLQYRRQCYRVALRRLNWDATDFCVAFDFAAEHLSAAGADRNIGRQRPRQARHYRRLSREANPIHARLRQLQSLVISSLSPATARLGVAGWRQRAAWQPTLSTQRAMLLRPPRRDDF